jgi:hypothetical protein
MVFVEELRFGPIGDYYTGQADRARPHSRRGMEADGAGDEDQRGDPCEGQKQCPENDFHAAPIILRLDGFCSARLQAGIRARPKCQPKGWRYIYVAGFSLSSQRICSSP